MFENENLEVAKRSMCSPSFDLPLVVYTFTENAQLYIPLAVCALHISLPTISGVGVHHRAQETRKIVIEIDVRLQ